MTVTVLRSMGDDLTIANAARVSFGRESEGLSDADRGIIRSMLKNGHGSPFEHVVITFRVETSIGVAREWFRHRIGSYNEISTRYTKVEPKFYVPENEAVRQQVGRAMEYAFEPFVQGKVSIGANAHWVTLEMEDAYNEAYRSYQRLLEEGVAKELARNVLPLGMLTQFWWTVNLRSLFNFLALRNAPQALYEIRQEALAVETLTATIVPFTMKTWNDTGRGKV